MASSNRRDLYLQVSGNIDGLSAAMKAGRSVLNEFGTAADNTADEVRKAFASLGGESVEQSARQIERAYSATFDKIRRNAKQVDSAPSGAAAFQIVDAAAADQAAGAAERQAAGLRLVADAAARAAAATKDDAGAARVYATAAEAAAIGAEREAVAMRGQSNVIAGVRNELGALGGAQTKAVAIFGQAKSGYQQLSYQLGDVATQYASGTAATIIFAQQSGQVVQAISLISGEAKGLLGLLGGPWGIVFSSALVVLSPFVGKLLESGDAVKKETDALKENAEKSAIADQAKGAFAKTEAGAADDVRKLTEELKKQNDALKTNAELTNIRAKEDLAQLQKDRSKLAKDLADARGAVRASNRPGTGGFAGTASVIQGQASQKVVDLQARLKALDGKIAEANADVQKTRANLADESAKRSTDKVAQINREYDGPDGLIEQAKKRAIAEGTVDAALTKQLRTLRLQQASRIEQANKEKSTASRTGNNNQLGRSITVADARTIVASIGGRVTSGLRSTADQERIYADKLAGRHVGPVAKPGTSDHERGQAVDIAYGPGITIAKIREAFAKQGVALRQILDEPTQRVFHVAFGKKGPSQEQTDRKANTEARTREAAEQKRIRDEEAYAQLKARAQQDLVDATRTQADTIEGAADLDVQMLRLEQDRLNSAAQAGVAEKRWSQAKADELKTLNAASADLKVAGVRTRERVATAERQRDVDRQDIAGQISLLELQGDLATTAKDRRAIALQILDLQEREARATLQAAIDKEKDPVRKQGLERELGRVEPAFAGRRDQAEQSNAGPLDRYRADLKSNTDDMNTALQGVAVNGLQTLESGLLGIIDGTESVQSAFKRMASSIVADLARIAIQKAIVSAIGSSFLGFAKGGEVKGYATGGQIIGPGTGTSDDILAWLSNGEFVMTAEATRRNLPTLKAMNDNRLPAFATGGMVGAMPRLPNVQSAANDVYGRRADRMQLDANVTVNAGPEFDARMESVSLRTVSATAEPIMAGATSRTMRKLGRGDLPGGFE